MIQFHIGGTVIRVKEVRLHPKSYDLAWNYCLIKTDPMDLATTTWKKLPYSYRLWAKYFLFIESGFLKMKVKIMENMKKMKK